MLSLPLFILESKDVIAVNVHKLLIDDSKKINEKAKKNG